ncbi:TIGR04222 domain-containing membrane protein [Streptomyces sp. NPDC029526]|uniref:TIGR04222 domain-containing membrane protein n=1 Tax=Streptomyces sp. NPDC029526 TaxID=3155728 RepID=UPI0033C4970A
MGDDDVTTVLGTPHEVALLGGGPRAAVTVAVVALHLRGAVEAAAPGTFRAVHGEGEQGLPVLPPPDAAPAPPDGRPGAVSRAERARYLESAVHSCLHEPCGLAELARRPDVRWAVAELRVPLAEAGLLRLPLLRPARAARRHLRALRTAHPVPASRRGLPDRTVLLAIALHGEPALRALVPRFALRTGLVERVRLRQAPLLRRSLYGGRWGGGSSGVGFACGDYGGSGEGGGGGCGGGGGGGD